MDVPAEGRFAECLWCDARSGRWVVSARAEGRQGACLHRALQSPVAVLADLCGPKIRVGRLAGGELELRDGEIVTLTTREVVGAPGLIPSQYAGLPQDVTPGRRVLLADGLIELRVEAVASDEVKCYVVHGGVLRDHKGINLPGTPVSAPALTRRRDSRDPRARSSLGGSTASLVAAMRPTAPILAVTSSIGANTRHHAISRRRGADWCGPRTTGWTAHHWQHWLDGGRFPDHPWRTFLQRSAAQ
jgi:pyruvate kinase